MADGPLHSVTHSSAPVVVACRCCALGRAAVVVVVAHDCMIDTLCVDVYVMCDRVHKTLFHPAARLATMCQVDRPVAGFVESL
jgi:hypothetical protein